MTAHPKVFLFLGRAGIVHLSPVFVLQAVFLVSAPVVPATKRHTHLVREVFLCLCFSGRAPDLGFGLHGAGLLSNVTEREVPLPLQHLGWLCTNFGSATKRQDRKTLIEVWPVG